MNTKIRYGLSAAVLALIGAGASAPQILDQFLDEKKVTTQWHTAMVLAYGPSVGVPQWWMENRFSQYETVEGKMRRSTPLSVIRRWHGWSAILKYH